MNLEGKWLILCDKNGEKCVWHVLRARFARDVLRAFCARVVSSVFEANGHELFSVLLCSSIWR